MTEISASSLPPLSAQWITERSFYVLLFVAVGALTCIKPMAGLAAALGIIAGVAVASRMETAVLVFAALIAFDLQIPVGFEQPLYLDLMFGLTAIPILLDLIKQRKQMNYRALIWLPFLLYALPVSLGRTADTRWLVASAARFLVLIVFSVAIALYANGERVVLALGWATVPVVGYGLFQLIIGGLGPLYSVLSGSAIIGSEADIWQGRSLGFFWHPNGMGAFCAVTAGALVALASRSHRRMAGQCYTFALIAVVGVLSSGSRGALIGLGAAVLVALTLNGKRGAWQAAIALAAVAATFAVASHVNLLPVARDTGGLDEFTEQGRMLVWGQAFLLFLQNPIFGCGWTNFHQMGILAETQFGAIAHAHNWYLNTLAETGIIGFLLFFGPLVWLVMKNLRMVRRDRTALVVVVALTAICVHSFVDVPFIEPQIALLVAVFVGLAAQTASTVGDGRSPEANHTCE